jgi:sulfur-oxidizing protein SoxX
MKTVWIRHGALAAALGACLSLLLPAPAAAQAQAPAASAGGGQAAAKTPVRTPAKWKGGEVMPIDDLMNYPCHFDNLPCGKIAPPKVEKVNFKGPVTGDAERGKKIALDVRYGNCVACHSLPGGIAGGSIGPSLADYAKRGMPPEYTFQRIWDVRVFNPDAFMPIYGPNKVLTKEEILDVMVFIESGK